MSQNNLSKTAALKAAQTACGSILRRSSTDYICMVPFYDERLDGPSTELQANSYPQIVQRRALKVATLALVLMGRGDAASEADYIVYQAYESMSAKAIVEAAIKLGDEVEVPDELCA